MIKKRIIMFLTLLVTLSFSLLYIRSRFLLVELSFLVSELERVAVSKEYERDTLLLELAVLKNPKRIQKIAKEKLYLLSSVHPVSITVKARKKSDDL